MTFKDDTLLELVPLSIALVTQTNILVYIDSVPSIYHMCSILRLQKGFVFSHMLSFLKTFFTYHLVPHHRPNQDNYP